MKKNKTPNYREAMVELQGLVDQLQSEDIPIDDLSEKVDRAKILIGSCREKLRNTEAEIDRILDDES